MDNNEKFIKYAPLILVVFAFFMQYSLFVTPKELEQHHREILVEVDNKYATKEKADTLQSQFDRLNEKMDKVLYILTDGRNGDEHNK